MNEVLLCLQRALQLCTLPCCNGLCDTNKAEINSISYGLARACAIVPSRLEEPQSIHSPNQLHSEKKIIYLFLFFKFICDITANHSFFSKPSFISFIYFISHCVNNSLDTPSDNWLLTLFVSFLMRSNVFR